MARAARARERQREKASAIERALLLDGKRSVSRALFARQGAPGAWTGVMVKRNTASFFPSYGDTSDYALHPMATCLAVYFAPCLYGIQPSMTHY